jgi:hypothetical protein
MCAACILVIHPRNARSLTPEFAAFSIPREDALIVGTVVMRWCAH